MSNLVLRKGTTNDADLLYFWRNQPYIVKLGSKNKRVSKEEHYAWYYKLLDSKYDRLYIIEFAGKAIGQIRYIAESRRRSIVSIYLIPEMTGKRIGLNAIVEGNKRLYRENKDLKEIIAVIKEGNTYSEKAFAKAGFKIEQGNKTKGETLWINRRV